MSEDTKWYLEDENLYDIYEKLVSSKLPIKPEKFYEYLVATSFFFLKEIKNPLKEFNKFVKFSEKEIPNDEIRFFLFESLAELIEKDNDSCWQEKKMIKYFKRYKKEFESKKKMNFIIKEIDKFIKSGEFITNWKNKNQNNKKEIPQDITSININQDSLSDLKLDKLSQLQFALFITYLQLGKYEKIFQITKAQYKLKNIYKTSAFIMNKYSVKKSSKNFTNLFYIYSKKKNRIDYKRIKDIETVIEKLSDFPKSLTIAKKELDDINELYSTN